MRLIWAIYVYIIRLERNGRDFLAIMYSEESITTEIVDLDQGKISTLPRLQHRATHYLVLDL